jgi:hypothetical protein
MKIITIGDIHGRNNWKFLIDKIDEYDKIIFIGDYFDSFTIPGIIQLQNFYDIIDFKRNNKDKVILLIGNHDYHYFPGIREDYSGYQASMRHSFEKALYEAYNDELLDVAYSHNKYLFSHAGLSKTWCNSNDIDLENVVESINDLFKFKPKNFTFSIGANLSFYGDDITQGPFWIRPKSLIIDMLDDYIQVVGHTSKSNINIFESKLILVDVHDYTDEFLLIDNNVHQIINN